MVQWSAPIPYNKKFFLLKFPAHLESFCYSTVYSRINHPFLYVNTVNHRLSALAGKNLSPHAGSEEQTPLCFSHSLTVFAQV